LPLGPFTHESVFEEAEVAQRVEEPSDKVPAGVALRTEPGRLVHAAEHSPLRQTLGARPVTRVAADLEDRERDRLLQARLRRPPVEVGQVQAAEERPEQLREQLAGTVLVEQRAAAPG